MKSYNVAFGENRKAKKWKNGSITWEELRERLSTPFRTAEEEQGLLAKIYSDGVKDGKAVSGDIGITYQIGLKELINRQILSKPIFESCYTDEEYGENLGLDDWESISRLDVLPEDIAGQIADSAARNKLIVETYLKNQEA